MPFSPRGRAAKMLRCAALMGAAAIGYARILRPRIVDWGATEDEATRSMPGDEVLPDAGLQTTRAISIDALPEGVWPWLVQMGPRPRAGAYTYDWIERLLGIDIANTDRILPEYQHLEVGELLGLDKEGAGLKVIELQKGRFLVLQWVPARSTWCFGLHPDGRGGTRLVSRNRLPGSGPRFRAMAA
ncbi:MAG TPA: SRPBCC family protein, partial [Dehalococcoidia bacterium]|nr:SRPBCC family protein [Dehalococcoidia bacterium]